MWNTNSLFTVMRGTITNRRPFKDYLILAVYLVVPFLFGCATKATIDFDNDTVMVKTNTDCRFYYKDKDREVDFDSKREPIIGTVFKELEIDN